MAQKVRHRNLAGLREVQSQGTSTGPTQIGPCTPDEDLNNFISCCRRSQEFVARKNNLYEPLKIGNWDENKLFLEILYHSHSLRDDESFTLLSTKAIGDNIQNKSVNKTVDSIKQSIQRKNEQLNYNGQYHNMGVVYVMCYFFGLKKVAIFPLFKVYKYSCGEQEKKAACFVTKHADVFSSLNEFLESCSTLLPHCFMCIPRDGEYEKSEKMPLEFFNINTFKTQCYSSNFVQKLAYSTISSCFQCLYFGPAALFLGFGTALGLAVDTRLNVWSDKICLMDMEPGTFNYKLNMVIQTYFASRGRRHDPATVSQAASYLSSYFAREGDWLLRPLQLSAHTARNENLLDATEFSEISVRFLLDGVSFLDEILSCLGILNHVFSREFRRLSIMGFCNVILISIISTVICHLKDRNAITIDLTPFEKETESYQIQTAEGEYSFRRFRELTSSGKMLEISVEDRKYEMRAVSQQLPGSVNDISDSSTDGIIHEGEEANAIENNRDQQNVVLNFRGTSFIFQKKY